MVIEVKENVSDNITNLLARLDKDKTKKPGKKTLADIYGKLKRGFDGLEYQKSARYGDWD
jgi:hypothetical protein